MSNDDITEIVKKIRNENWLFRKIFLEQATGANKVEKF